MNDQPVIDAYHHQDLRRTRSALHNIVPVDTGLARGIERLLPHLEGRFNSVAMRVPTMNVSAIDMVLNVREATSLEAVNGILARAAEGPLKGILGYTDELLASSDFNHDARSGVVDGGQTRVTGLNGALPPLPWRERAGVRGRGQRRSMPFPPSP